MKRRLGYYGKRSAGRGKSTRVRASDLWRDLGNAMKTETYGPRGYRSWRVHADERRIGIFPRSTRFPLNKKSSSRETSHGRTACAPRFSENNVQQHPMTPSHFKYSVQDLFSIRSTMSAIIFFYSSRVSCRSDLNASMHFLLGTDLYFSRLCGRSRVGEKW